MTEIALTPRQQRRAARKAARLLAAKEAQAPARTEPTPAEVQADKRAVAAIQRVIGKPTGFVKATDVDKGGYAVFVNANRRSALRCPLDGGGMLEYIALTDEALKVETCTEMFFNTLWERAEYDVKRAATAYAAAAKWRGITDEAKLHLERVLGTPLKNLKTQLTAKKEHDMNRKSTSQVTSAVRGCFIDNDTLPAAGEAAGGPSAAAGAAARPPISGSKADKAARAAAKLAAAPKITKKTKAKKPAAKKTKAKGKKEKQEPTGKRAEMHAKRIKVIISKNPKREGTAAWKKFEVYKTAKTVGEALEKGAKVGFRMSTINYDLKHKYIQLVAA